MRKSLLIAFAFITTGAVAAPTTMQVGKWRVQSSTDPMTDKRTCIAYYGAENFIQVTSDSFAVTYAGRGGIQGYTLRFDSDPPTRMFLPTDVEQQIGAFVIKQGGDSVPSYRSILGKPPELFERFLSAKRVRIQTVTLVSGIVNDDVDLTDLPALMEKLRGPECN